MTIMIWGFFAGKKVLFYLEKLNRFFENDFVVYYINFLLNNVDAKLFFSKNYQKFSNMSEKSYCFAFGSSQ